MTSALDTSLELLRTALRSYLQHLRSHWDGTSSAVPPSGELDRLVAAVGCHPKASEADRAAAGDLLEELAGPSGGGDALRAMATALSLTPAESLLVSAAWWAETDPQLATLFGCAQDDGGRRFASAALMRLVLAPFDVDLPASVDDHDPLVHFGVLEVDAGASGPLRLTPTARRWLAGGRLEPLRAVRPVPERLRPHVEGLARHLASRRPGIVALRGPVGGGRRGTAIAAAEAAGTMPIALDRPLPELRLLGRLGVAVPVAAPGDADVVAQWRAEDGPLVAIVDPVAAPPAGALVVELSPPSHADRARHWNLALAGAGLSAAPSTGRELAARFSFTEGDIDASVRRAIADAEWRGEDLTDEHVWRAARRQPEHALARLANLVSPAFTLDDLVLAPDCREQLEELIAHVTLQHVVLDEWGFRRRLPRGQGVVALFAGPSGTGKTMAVEAIAAALRQDLYRIDLSAVVSKYIGETEKNLAAAFDEAERAGAVLFFDEADSLFGKRSEVKDSHDRYANLEVSYLLQRVETFTGLVVLASNRRAALDEAFVRRLRFVVRFDPPDAELRERLWRQSFPAGVRLDALDWGALAGPELSGGNIQSVALHAAYRAAADGGRVRSQDVEAALRREFEKLGRAWAGLERR